MSGMPGAPHNPGRGTSERTGECKHLDSSVTLERCTRNDTVLDGFGGASSDSDGSNHLKDSTEDHGLAIGDGSRGNTGGPGVGNIVGTVVESIEKGKEGAYGEDIVVLREHGHLDGWLSGLSSREANDCCRWSGQRAQKCYQMIVQATETERAGLFSGVYSRALKRCSIRILVSMANQVLGSRHVLVAGKPGPPERAISFYAHQRHLLDRLQAPGRSV